MTLSNIEHTFLRRDNESLIPRGRNTLVAEFMRDPRLSEYDTFMFIDSDILFEAEDVAKLWNLGVDVATAAYPMKRDNVVSMTKAELNKCGSITLPVTSWTPGIQVKHPSRGDGVFIGMDGDEYLVAFPPNVTAWKDGKLVDLSEFNGPTPIDYAGTGFLMIKRSAFEKVQDAHPEARHMEGKVGECYDLFPVGVTEEEDWRERYYRSEDYGFCEWWRELGGQIILEPSIRLGHVGRKVYR
jgi:hypothetical protein